ncbi:MAG: hypothetical protein QOE70_4345 [Chthoniobacter sp.]|jgi:hypothetical protein|nr:hypothetical protein [Chthoniobacter sp.]
MNPYRPVAVEEARQIAELHGIEQIVVWSFRTDEGQHVTTYGHPLGNSLRAAEAGNVIKIAAGWPPELAQALPHSLAELFAALDVVLAAEICNGSLAKGTVLATLTTFRDAVRERDPELAEPLIPTACEAAEPRTALEQLEKEEGR